MTSSHAPSYSSVSQYIEENGKENFIDMYIPEYYFNSATKKTVSSLKGLQINYKIYHQNNPKEYYSLCFDKFHDDLLLTIVVDKSNDMTSEHFSDYTLEKQGDYKFYSRNDDMQVTCIGMKNHFKISVIIEFVSHQSKEEINQFNQISKDMIRDMFTLNHL